MSPGRYRPRLMDLDSLDRQVTAAVVKSCEMFHMGRSLGGRERAQRIPTSTRSKIQERNSENSSQHGKNRSKAASKETARTFPRNQFGSSGPAQVDDVSEASPTSCFDFSPHMCAQSQATEPGAPLSRTDVLAPGRYSDTALGAAEGKIAVRRGHVLVTLPRYSLRQAQRSPRLVTTYKNVMPRSSASQATFVGDDFVTGTF